MGDFKIQDGDVRICKIIPEFTAYSFLIQHILSMRLHTRERFSSPQSFICWQFVWNNISTSVDSRRTLFLESNERSMLKNIEHFLFLITLVKTKKCAWCFLLTEDESWLFYYRMSRESWAYHVKSFITIMLLYFLRLISDIIIINSDNWFESLLPVRKYTYDCFDCENRLIISETHRSQQQVKKWAGIRVTQKERSPIMQYRDRKAILCTPGAGIRPLRFFCPFWAHESNHSVRQMCWLLHQRQHKFAVNVGLFHLFELDTWWSFTVRDP
jgi:hypothetical protein